MEKKSNEATPLRPMGGRPLNAPSINIDLNKLMLQIKSETTWSKSDHNSITVYKSDSMRIVLIGLHPNSELKTHTANAYLSVQVIKGSIKFQVEDTEHKLLTGQMVTVQPNIPHRVRSREESFILLTLAIPKTKA